VKVESIIIKGFRCFDETGQTISFDQLTCFVGPNASGKTAALMALARVFGESGGYRQVVTADFHLASGETLKDKPSRNLAIECRLRFPELKSGSTTDAIPETFNQMIVDEPDGEPYCRIRLEATWTNDGTPSGDIEQRVFWIHTSSEDPKEVENHSQKIKPGDRGNIRVVYVPAARDPDNQIRTTTNTSFGRLLESLDWKGVDESLRGKMEELQAEIIGLSGLKSMNEQIQAAWQGLYEGDVAREVMFQAIEEEPASLIKLLSLRFRPGEDGRNMDLKDLSDGLRSLFSLSLSLGFFRVEEQLRVSAEAAGFNSSVIEDLPILTIFAVEEPENHLSPHYLGRIVSELESISENDGAQVVLSSHSPSILRRVEPDNVRYFLGNETTSLSAVKGIPLPGDRGDEAFKYVREAVRGFPELYFSHLVVLGEGPSEEIVLRRLFEVSGAPLDTHFISIVPLGGRHVNHFWKLLHGLGIPYITLLDLDREKEGAGWGRIKYVRDQLVNLHGAGTLKYLDSNKVTHTLDSADFGVMDVKDTQSMDAWINHFRERYRVYFSSPLDLDFAMLEAFPVIYKSLAPSGPRLPDNTDEEYPRAVQRRMKQVLAADESTASDDLGSTYSVAQQEVFPWYKYLFVDGSKPVNHMRALLLIDSEQLASNAPEVLRSIVTDAQAQSLV